MKIPFLSIAFFFQVFIINVKAETIYNVQDFGATGQKSQKVTTHIQEAIDGGSGFIEEEIAIAREAGVPMKRYYKVPPFVSLGYLVDCTNVHIKEVSFIESSSWTMHIQWSERVFINNIHIKSSLEAGVNADGLDIDGCKEVVISDCVIETGDDAIVLKSTLTNDHFEDCRNVTESNCVLTSTSSALIIGTETH